MSSSNRALLIASPYGRLRGPENDVQVMSKVLEKLNFGLVQCRGSNATREGIRTAWQQLISESSADDAVVIYYSGHGGLVESELKLEKVDDSEKPWRYQFLVPMDYNQTTEDDFRGILDIEISHLLRETTAKTRNVTLILDCCHAGRMARDPRHGNRAFSKSLPTIQHYDISKHVERLHQNGQLRGETFVEGNPYAVRIAAAATTETAWEYENTQGQYTGILTEALACAISEANGRDVSWRTTLLRIREVVNAEFPQQSPHVEGPDTRILFSVKEAISGSLAITVEDGVAIIQAGRVAGVRERNVYTIMPAGSEQVDNETQIGEATVSHVNGFKARVDLSLKSMNSYIPYGGALAFLHSEALYQWPVLIPDDFEALRGRLEKSKFLRCYGANEEGNPLVGFRQEGEKVIVCDNFGVPLISRQPAPNSMLLDTVETAVLDAERLARAQHFLALKCESTKEVLNHNVEVKIGTVTNGHPERIIQQDGQGSVTENEKVYVSVHNHGNSLVFASVFDINIAGKITLLSNSHPTGIELHPSLRVTIGEDQFTPSLIRGMRLGWPDAVPKTRPIEERLFVVISSRAVDLRHLATQARPYTARGKMSSIQMLTYHLSSGCSRDIEPPGSQDECNQYDVLHISFLLNPMPREETAFW